MIKKTKYCDLCGRRKAVRTMRLKLSNEGHMCGTCVRLIKHIVGEANFGHDNYQHILNHSVKRIDLLQIELANMRRKQEMEVK